MVRFCFIALFFLISLLAIFKAPEYHLWLLSIGVTEFPLVFFVISLLITLTGFWAHKYQMAGTILGVITMLIYLSPIFRAYWVAKDVKADISGSFKGIPGAASTVSFPSDQRAPLRFLSLFRKADPLSYKTITYVTYKDTAMTMDFYPSQVLGKRPCVIVVHGGSWAGGDSQQLPELNSYLAKKGYNVTSINYRMAPKWQTPAPVEDIKACITYLKAHEEDLKIDTHAVGLAWPFRWRANRIAGSIYYA